MVSFLDVGQGDATLIQLDGDAVLVDTGPPDGPILERLGEARVKRLDALFLTHAEADHEGAAPAVIAAYTPAAGRRRRRRLATRRPARAAAAPRGGARAPSRRGGPGDRRRRPALRVLWPPPRDRLAPDGNPNDHALVARLDAGGVLDAADRRRREQRHRTRCALEPVDVLKVAHHGSADPGLPELLKRLQPADRGDRGRPRTTRYGHPTPSTLAGAQRRGADASCAPTSDGTVRLHVAGDRMWVQR